VEQKKFYLRQMSHMPDDLVTYKGIGKAFIHMTRTTIMEKMEAAAKEEQQLAEDRVKKSGPLAQRVKNTEKELRELLESSEELQHAVAPSLGQSVDVV
jgi:chaperonin cofactor prefoldin